MARKPHLKTSFDPEILDGLVERAKQAEMKSPQDYVRYLVQRDDEDMGVHVAFEEREKAVKEHAGDLRHLGELLECSPFIGSIHTAIKDLKKACVSNDKDLKKVYQERDEFRMECGVLTVSRDHWKKEFEHQKKERDTLKLQLNQIADYLDCALKDGEKHGTGWQFNSTITAINNLKNGKKQAEIDRDEFEKQMHNETDSSNKFYMEWQSVKKERDEWIAKANEAAAEAVKIADDYQRTKNCYDSLYDFREDVASELKIDAADIEGILQRVVSMQQDLETTKADLKHTNNAAIENMKVIAIALGVPDTVEHVVQCIEELKDQLRQWSSIGIALGVGPTYEKASQRIADLAFEPIYMVIWRRVRQFFNDSFRHKGNE